MTGDGETRKGEIDQGLRSVLLVFALLVFLPSISLSALEPPTDVKAFDTPNDAGGTNTVTWVASPQDSLLLGYSVKRSTEPEGPFVEAGFVLKGQQDFQDGELKDGQKYYYRVDAKVPGDSSSSTIAGPAVPRPQWFDFGRLNLLIFIAVFVAFVFWYISRAKKGENLFIRRIAGLDAVEEAVGRSTEMGRPLLFIPGLLSIDDVTTLAALTILGRVARKAAEYDTPVLVPCTDPLVMTTAQEIVKQSYSEAGRPDAFREGNIYFLTSDQFGYAAGCDGLMLREKPGAVFLQGYFYAESLILAETGHSIGAIQIAGTTATDQLPFFVTACDYTLIGEEMYAASSYLTREPIMLGTLKGEDLMKLLIVLILTAGVIFETFGKHWLMWLFNSQ